jgi:hypothetical protein
VLGAVSARNAGKGCALLQVLNEPFDIVQVPCQHVLLFFLGPDVLSRRATAVVAADGARSPVECAGQFACARRACRLQWCLGHQIKVQKLQELDLDALRRLFVLEQACHGKQAVHVLECPSVVRSRKQCGHEDEKGGRLYRGAVVGVEEVEEQVHVDLAAEDDARWRMQ